MVSEILAEALNGRRCMTDWKALAKELVPVEYDEFILTKGSGRRPDAVEFTDMQTDVKRRDLTINALYYDIDKGEVIDFVGGVKDIRNAKIRTVGQPTDRFDEDALRKLRAVRFAGRMGSKMDKATYEAIKRDPSLPGVSGERIRDEFMKGIRTAKSSKSYILLCFELKLMPLILPSMKLRKPTSESKDPIVQIADILRDNDINRVNKLMNSMKYSKRENAQVRFLLEFADFHIDKLTILKRAEERCGISKESLIEFGVIVKKRKEAIKFANFKLSVRGGDAPDKLPKKNIGNWMQDAERQKYLNEVNMRKSELRRIIREEISQLNEQYYPTASGAAQIARDRAEKRGYEIDEDDWFNNIAVGGKYNRLRPSIGDTHSYTIRLLKNGKPQRKSLRITIYGMASGSYELVDYIA